ncbi:MAG: hypothetical protein ACTIJA_05530 [Bavariicoccus seileri]|uniref:hypothetical protein n=1 Tax=Bavariicoccus seileri TaxID=549685 RepID=UPI003F8ECC03
MSNKQAKATMAKKRQEVGLRNMYFNRYLLIRYITAVFFFSNLYWFVFLAGTKSIFLGLPLVLLVGMVVVVWEQIKTYRDHRSEIPSTRLYYRVQLALNAVLCFSVYTPLFTSLFPFVKNSSEGKSVVLLMLVLGALLCVVVERKLQLISRHKDRHYGRIMAYKKAITH